MKHAAPLLVAAGLLGLAASPWLAVPAWAWLAVMAGGLAHSIAWRRAAVRRVSARERRKHEVRLRNAERRERRLVRTALRTERKVKLVLERSVDMEWAERMAGAVRQLQEDRDRHEAALLHARVLQEKVARDFSDLYRADGGE